MGDRGNIVMQFEGEQRIFLYTHWNGSGIAGVVRRALSRRQRWDDDAYLTRIIFDELTQGQQGKETGFGISVQPPDNSHDFVVVDVGAQAVRLENPDTGKVKQTWTFEEFVNDTSIA
jgi:hypothetical protein